MADKKPDPKPVDPRHADRAKREAEDKAIAEAVRQLIFDGDGTPRPLGGA